MKKTILFLVFLIAVQFVNAQILPTYTKPKLKEKVVPKPKPKPQPIPTFTEPEMVFVQGGTFSMGSNSGEADEKPIHSVTLSSFKIGKYEVTQAQWHAVMGSNPSYFKGCATCPVEQVSSNDIQEFLKKINQLTGKNYRLPTEAEWEFAARGGNRSQGYTYAGSNTLSNVAWYDYKSNSKTHPFGHKQANELGIYDMTGNVDEFCSDFYDNTYYTNSPSSNPKGPTSDYTRVLRGGSWYSSPTYCRVADRGYSDGLSGRYNSVGFRVALSQ